MLKLLHLVHSPDRTKKGANLEISASISSLCLEDTSSTASASTVSTLALGAWAALRKTSAPFFADDAEGSTPLEF